MAVLTTSLYGPPFVVAAAVTTVRDDGWTATATACAAGLVWWAWVVYRRLILRWDRKHTTFLATPNAEAVEKAATLVRHPTHRDRIACWAVSFRAAHREWDAARNATRLLTRSARRVVSAALSCDRVTPRYHLARTWLWRLAPTPAYRSARVVQTAAEVLHHRGNYEGSIELSTALWRRRRAAVDGFNVGCSLSRLGRDDEAVEWILRAVDAGMLPHAVVEDADVKRLLAHPRLAPVLGGSHAGAVAPDEPVTSDYF